eukprot:6476752-Amphidinium_carterae.2
MQRGPREVLQHRRLGLIESVAEDTEESCPHEFCGGPGLVPPGVEYKVTFYSTTPSCGLKAVTFELQNLVHYTGF